MSSVINEAVEAVIGLINATEPFATVTRGALPTGPGIVVEVGPSSPNAVYLDKAVYIPLDLTINGKHHDLRLLSDTLNNIHGTLTRARSYPYDTNAGRWKIVDITNNTLPQIIGREDNSHWLMASSLSVRVYWEE